jgi:hypothetical protein
MRSRAIVAAATAALSLAMGTGCGGSSTTEPKGPPGALAAACGPKLVLQTDWYPEPEHGGVYALIGPGGRVDGKRGTYSGEIGDTGVELEIRAGGPYIGDQPVSSLLYQDSTILGGFVGTDEAVRFSGKLPTVAVTSTMNISPAALMWDPSRFHFTSFADIGKTHVPVLYYENTEWIRYLLGKGYLRREQLDSSYDGSPARFVSERGNLVQEAYATSEPYKYEHDLAQWRKPVAFELVSDSGYRPYAQTIAVRPQTLRTKAGCLRALVPLVQQAEVDYMRAPGPVNAAILDEIDKLKSPWTLSAGNVDDAVAKMRRLGIVANSPLGSIGSFDMRRVQATIAQLTRIYASENVTTVKKGVSAEDIATNRFIDHRIHLAP